MQLGTAALLLCNLLKRKKGDWEENLMEGPSRKSFAFCPSEPHARKDTRRLTSGAEPQACRLLPLPPVKGRHRHTRPRPTWRGGTGCPGPWTTERPCKGTGF